jgi:phosphomevalonate kinase
MSTKRIIGISGKLGCGKDYISTNVVVPILEKHHQRYLGLNLADQIKINVMTKNHIEYKDVYEKKTESSRQLLQTEGTEIGRAFDKNIWINYLDNWMKVFSARGISTFIVTDVRFQNEVEYVKNAGGILVRIIAPKRNHQRLMQEADGNESAYTKISTHRSECDLDLLPNDMFDLIIYNDPDDSFDTNNLQKQLETLLHL